MCVYFIDMQFVMVCVDGNNLYLCRRTKHRKGKRHTKNGNHNHNDHNDHQLTLAAATYRGASAPPPSIRPTDRDPAPAPVSFSYSDSQPEIPNRVRDPRHGSDSSVRRNWHLMRRVDENLATVETRR